jgi:hypothetical protein
MLFTPGNTRLGWSGLECFNNPFTGGSINICGSRLFGSNYETLGGIRYPQRGQTNAVSGGFSAYYSYPLSCPTPTPTQSPTQTPSNTPTLTPTNTKTPTPTPTSTPPQEFCNYPTISSDNSLDIDITDVTISGVSVTHISGATFPIGSGDGNGYFASNVSGSSVTLRVYYNSSISGQNITVQDCDEVVQCCNTSTGTGIYCEFTIDLSCGCAWTITASDGACS